MEWLKIGSQVRKYRFVLLVLAAGLALMLLPTASQKQTEPVIQETQPEEDMESRLERILSKIQGAGKVAVMLTESGGEEVLYQTDGDGGDTVLITDASRNEQALVRTRQPPTYRGAIVVCAGADSAAVRLAVVEAVANVTGLGTDKITVLKME